LGIVVELILDEARRCAIARSLEPQRVTGRPTGRDRRAARNLNVARQGSVLVAHVEVLLVTVVPPSSQLDDPTGNRHGHLLIALADGRGFEFGHPLLEIRAAVAPQIRSFGWM